MPTLAAPTGRSDISPSATKRAMTSERERARSFGAVASAYHRVRPSYPGEAVAGVLPAGPTRAVDVGATGMREVLAASVAAAQVHNGTVGRLVGIDPVALPEVCVTLTYTRR